MTLDSAATLALQALGFILADGTRAERFLDLTGLTPDILRSAANQPETLAAILDFLLAYEPDLLLCAANLEIAPAKFAQARAVFSPAPEWNT
jgi:outer membrane protein TolC